MATALRAPTRALRASIVSLSLLGALGLGAGSCTGPAGAPCTVADNGDGTSTISCPDGTTVTVENGRDGMDGSACTVADNGDGTRTITCDDGTTVTVSDGDPGDPGPSGNNAYVTDTGLTVEIVSAEIGADRRPVVTLTMTDRDGLALDREGLRTEGAVSVSFLVAYLSVDAEGSTRSYVSYLSREVTSDISGMTASQATSESSGTWALLDPLTGTYEYTFSAALPEGYDATRTHTIGLYATRTVDEIRYVENALFHFRPDGEEVTELRQIVTTEGCNTCHDPLAIHGGARRETGLCILCHNPGSTDPDTGNTVDLPVMVHRIHMGAELPSVQAGTPYQIIGFRGSVHDYSDVRFPQPNQNCATCHTGADGERWRTEPTRVACGACHDDISFAATPPAGSVPHRGGPQSDDSNCSFCHMPSGGLAGITDIHLTPENDPASPELLIELLAVRNTAPTQTPEIDFRVTVDGVGRDVLASPIDSLRVTVAGPTTDYRGYKQYTMTSTGTLLAIDASAGEFRYIFPETMEAAAATFSDGPVPAEGSFAFGTEGYLRLVAGGTRYASPNSVVYAPVTDAVAVPRREAVAIERCNECHDALAFHGGSRRDTEYCVFCHNASNDNNETPLPAAGMTALRPTVRFGAMIHRIHTGEEGANPYSIWSRGTEHDYTELRFPGDRRNCATCHTGDVSLPLPAGVVPTITREIDETGAVVATWQTPPIASACLGCHDTDEAAAHAEIMTTAIGTESCAVCHGEGDELGLDRAHARPEYE